MLIQRLAIIKLVLGKLESMKYFTVIILSMMQILSIGFTQEYSKWELPEGAIARIGKGYITDKIVFSPDSTKIIIPSTIGLWFYDATTYKELRLLPINVSNIVFSPDGSVFAKNKSWDNTVELWDISYDPIHANLRTTLKGHTKDITSIVYTSDGNTIATASEDRTIILWNTNTGENMYTLKGHTRDVTTITFSPDNTMLASGSTDGTSRIWNAETGQEIHKLNMSSKPLSYEDAVYSVAFSTDNRMLVNLTYDGTIRLWNTNTGKLIRTFKEKLNVGLYDTYFIAFSPDNRTIVTIDNDSSKLWNVRTGKSIWEHKGRIHISPEWKQFACYEQDRISISDMNTREIEKTFLDVKSENSTLVFSPDGKKLANDLEIWDITIGKHTQINEKHISVRTSVSIIDENTIACWDKYGIQIWDINAHKLIRTFSGDVTEISSDGMIVAIGINKVNNPPLIQLRNTKTGEEEEIISTENRGRLELLQFSPDSKTLVSRVMSSEPTLELWDVETGNHKLTINIKDYNVISVDFFPDNQMLIGLGDYGIPIWNVNTGELITTLKGHTGGVNYIVFSPDKSVLASASHDETVRLWNTKTYQLLATLIGHTESVSSIVFFPNGETVATKSYFGHTRLWDTKTGKFKKTLFGYQPVSFLPDGETFVNIVGNAIIEFGNIETLEPILTLDTQTDQVDEFVISKDGKTIVSVGRTILLWKLDNPNLQPRR